MLRIWGPEVAAIPARHKKSWIKAKDDLSSLPGLRRIASFGRLRGLLRLRIFCPRRRQDSSNFSKVR